MFKQKCRSKIEILFLIFISGNISKGFGCPDGNNLNLGSVVEPYMKNSQAISHRSESEITNIVNILCKKFSRISLYGSHDPTSIDSKVLLEVAKYNSKNTNERAISVLAAVQSSDIRDYEINLARVVKEITESNRIHPGTVTGLIVSSTDFTDVHEHQIPDKLNLTQSEVILILSKLRRSKQALRGMPKLINRARSQTDHKKLQIGVRSGNCDDIESKLLQTARLFLKFQDVLNFINDLVNKIDFVICHLIPDASTKQDKPTDAFIAKMDKVFQFFKKQWPSLKIIMETGWPTERETAAGFKASVASMQSFWCNVEEWSKNNSAQVDMYTAFDGTVSLEDVSGSNFGWWIRSYDEKSGFPVYIEKINYTPPGDKTTRWIMLTILGCVVLIAIAIIIVYFKVNSVKNRFLTKQEINEFVMGDHAQRHDEVESEDTLRLPFESAYEIAHSRISIDKHQILGKGAFGIVYRGGLDNNYTQAAFKVTQRNCTSRNLKCLLSEIKILIYVGRHPNVVSIIGACTGKIQQGKVIIVIELCENGSLDKFLKAQKLMLENKPEEVNSCNKKVNVIDEQEGRNEMLLRKLAQLVHEIASGMEFIALKNVIHADLAARNILLTVDGTAKITDFGLSRRLYEHTNYVKQNQEPIPWRWMALESLEQLTFSTKTDVWSFGVTLYEMFSLGNVPYPGLSWSQNFTKLLRDGLRLERPRLASPGMHEIMKSCFFMNPTERPTFSDLKISLQNLFPNLEKNEYMSVED